MGGYERIALLRNDTYRETVSPNIWVAQITWET